MGGPEDAGKVYMEGEKGPELSIPNSDRSILPADLTAKVMSAARGGASDRSSDSGSGSDVHCHTNHFTVAPQIHVSDKVDRRSEEAIHGAVGDAVRRAMRELR